MKIILALTGLLAASAVNLAATHESHADTLIVFAHGADGAETDIVRQPGLTARECAAKEKVIWTAAHKADIAALDAACLPN